MSEASDPSYCSTDTLIRSLRRDLGEVSKRLAETDVFAREAQATLWEIERRHKATTAASPSHGREEG